MKPLLAALGVLFVFLLLSAVPSPRTSCPQNRKVSSFICVGCQQAMADISLRWANLTPLGIAMRRSRVSTLPFLRLPSHMETATFDEAVARPLPHFRATHFPAAGAETYVSAHKTLNRQYVVHFRLVLHSIYNPMSGVFRLSLRLARRPLAITRLEHLLTRATQFAATSSDVLEDIIIPALPNVLAQTAGAVRFVWRRRNVFGQTEELMADGFRLTNLRGGDVRDMREAFRSALCKHIANYMVSPAPFRPYRRLGEHRISQGRRCRARLRGSPSTWPSCVETARLCRVWLRRSQASRHRGQR